MVRALKRIFLRVALPLRIPQLLHKLFLRDKLTVLTYHGVTRHPLDVADACFLDVEAFRRQLDYLVRNFRVVSLREALRLLESEAIRGPTVAITFDDGYRNNLDVALPVLEEFNVPATVFLTTGFIATDDTMWFCRLNRALELTRAALIDVGDRQLPIDSPAQKASVSIELQAHLKRLHPSQLLAETDRIVARLLPDQELDLPGDDPRRMLDRPGIRAMLESGLVDFGAHTRSHPILTKLSHSERVSEIESSVREVASLTGRCEMFAYPNGCEGDFDDECIKLLDSLGLSAAFTMIRGPNHHRTPRLQMRRYGIAADTTFSEFQSTAHHFWWLARRAARRV